MLYVLIKRAVNLPRKPLLKGRFLKRRTVVHVHVAGQEKKSAAAKGDDPVFAEPLVFLLGASSCLRMASRLLQAINWEGTPHISISEAVHIRQCTGKRFHGPFTVTAFHTLHCQGHVLMPCYNTCTVSRAPPVVVGHALSAHGQKARTCLTHCLAQASLSVRPPPRDRHISPGLPAL